MYYDIKNNKELRSISEVRRARPTISLPKVPTKEQLLKYDIATVVVPKAEPTYNTKVSSRKVELIDGIYTMVYTYEDLPLQEVKDRKCKEIDSNTASKITSLVGTEVQQRNLTAKSSQLLLKKLNDDITDEELDLLNSLNDMFAQVEQWIIDGNTLEAEVQEMTTIEDVEAVEV